MSYSTKINNTVTLPIIPIVSIISFAYFLFEMKLGILWSFVYALGIYFGLITLILLVVFSFAILAAIVAALLAPFTGR